MLKTWIELNDMREKQYCFSLMSFTSNFTGLTAGLSRFAGTGMTCMTFRDLSHLKRLVWTCKNLQVLAWFARACVACWTLRGLPGLAGACRDLQELKGTCGDLHRLARTYRDLQGLVKTCKDLQGLGTGEDLQRLAGTCRGLQGLGGT